MDANRYASSASPAKLLAFCWAVPSWALGLVLGVLLVRSHRGFGFTLDEAPAILFANAVVAGLGFGSLAGAAFLLAAATVAAIRGNARSALSWRLHLAVAGGLLAGWLPAALGMQSGLSGGRRAAWLAAAAALGALVAAIVYGGWPALARRPRLTAGAHWLGRAGTALMLVVSVALAALVWQAQRSQAQHLPPGAADVLAASTMAPVFPPIEAALSRDPADGRVMVIGIDGLSWSILGPLIAAGEAPNFARLQAAGYSAVLSTLTPTKSPNIWTTVATGRDPSEHGILDFAVLRYPGLRIPRLYHKRWLLFTEPLLEIVADGEYLPVSSQDRRIKALWNLASEAGASVATVGWWASWPAEAVNGFVVSDRTYLDAFRAMAIFWQQSLPSVGSPTYPAELHAELGRFLQPLSSATPAELEPFVHLTADDRVRFASFIEPQAFTAGGGTHPMSTMTLSLLKDRFYDRSALFIADAHRPELLMVYFSAVDWFSHAVFEMTVPEARELGHDPADIARYRDALRELVKLMDTRLGRYLERADERTTVVVLSDHGFQKETTNGRVGYSHNRAPPGVLLMAGRGIAPRPGVAEAEIRDVGPTLFYLLGLPLSEELDGQPLNDALDPAYVVAHPPRRIGTYEAGPPLVAPSRATAGDDAVMENLRALGYIE